MDLTTVQARGLIEQTAVIGRRQKFMPILVFSGGEPLCRSDMWELLDFTRQQEIPAALATNGTLITDVVAEQIKASGVRRVSVSLDGAASRIHNQLRKQPGSFEAAIAGIGCLCRLGIPFQINMTLTRQNRHQLDEVIALAKSLGAEALHLFMLVPVGCGRTLTDEQMLSPAEYEEVLSLIAQRAGGETLEIKVTCAPHYQRIVRQQKNNPCTKSAHPGYHAAMSKGCLAGLGVLFVSHRGDVQPCGYLPVQCGNILHKPLSSIWSESPDLAAMRDTSQLKGKCRICGYRQVCGGCRARAFAATGDYLEAEPTCNYMPPVNSLGELDMRILAALQDAFPLETDPYAILAEKLGTPANELFSRVLELKNSGTIRRMGFSLDSRKLGFFSTLAAIRISPARIGQAEQVINAYPQITHSYLRDGEFNIWFTVIASDQEQVDAIVEQIRLQLNLATPDILNLPAVKTFKLDARFR